MTADQTNGTTRYTELLPPLSSDEYDALKADIAERGCLVPVEVDEHGDLLDGAHRTRICEELGIEPPHRIQRIGLSSDQAKRDYARKINLLRRHLTTKGKRELISAALIETPERSNRGIAAGLGVSDKTVAAVRGELVDGAEIPHQETRVGTDGIEQPVAKSTPEEPSDAPEQSIFEIGGDQTKAQAEQAEKRAEKQAAQEAEREANAKKVAKVADPKDAGEAFATIVIDPPWDFSDEGDKSQFGRGRPGYAAMSVEQVADLPIGEMAARDAHLYLWITNRSLPKGFDLLEGWGFRYITCLTWVKPSFGMGNYFRGSTEQILFGVKGSLPLLRKNVPTHFAAPRGPDGHSSKPAELYGLVRSCSPGPRIDYFGRRPHEGFTLYGEGGLAA